MMRIKFHQGTCSDAGYQKKRKEGNISSQMLNRISSFSFPISSEK
jgi:hypothetical protein